MSHNTFKNARKIAIYIYSRDSGEQTTGTVQSPDSATYLDLPTQLHLPT